ncbi:MAG: hypothetical protein AAB791_00530 [Patescibacteria group bacterium]
MPLFKFREAVLSSPAKRDKSIIVSLTLAFIINASIWLALIFNFKGSTEYVISYYNIYFGISALSNWFVLLLAPLLGILIIAVNFILSFFFYLKYQVLSHLLSVSALIFNIFLLLFGLLIIYTNL